MGMRVAVRNMVRQLETLVKFYTERKSNEVFLTEVINGEYPEILELGLSVTLNDHKGIKKSPDLKTFLEGLEASF